MDSAVKALVVGAGIAGLTAAWWLVRDGHDVDVIERAKSLREDGYMIDFFGSGWDVAERMGLLADLAEIHYPVDELVTVAEDGRVRTRLPYAKVRSAFFDGRHFNFMRGDLLRVLFDALPRRVHVRFGEGFERGREKGYDLVIGADGVHSKVRTEMLGATNAERFLGFHAAAYVIDDERLARRLGSTFQTMTIPNRMAAVYPIRGGKIATFFVWSSDLAPAAAPNPRETLRHAYADVKWLVPDLLERIPHERDVYFDAVSQVVLDKWSAPKVTLVGDACQAVSLLAGQGASMAMGGAWALAEEVRRGGALEHVLSRYEARVKPLIESKQRSGRNMAARGSRRAVRGESRCATSRSAARSCRAWRGSSASASRARASCGRDPPVRVELLQLQRMC